MRHKIRWFRILVIIGSLIYLFTDDAMSSTRHYTVTGQIRTSNGTKAGCNLPVKWIRVDVVDDDGWAPDDLCATGYTDENGDFSISFDWSDYDLDMMISVLGWGKLPAGTNQYYIYLKSHGGSNVLDWEKVGNKVITRPPAGTVAFDTLHLDDNMCNVATHINEAIRYALANQSSTTNWEVPSSLSAFPRNDDGSSYCREGRISIEKKDYDDPDPPQGAPKPGGKFTGGAFSDIHHETAHWIQWKAYGGRWPYSTYSPDPHDLGVESCAGFALCEGWAEYFAHISYIPDYKNELPNTTIWRGWAYKSSPNKDNKGDNNYDREIGMGEIVEGAILSIWAEMNDFPGIFDEISNEKPDSFQEWLEPYLIGKSEIIRKVAFEKAQKFGIVYSRWRIDGFLESAPSSDSPPSAGNFLVINGVSFLRGSIYVLTSIADFKQADSSTCIPIDTHQIGYKIITTPENLDDNLPFPPSLFTYFSEVNGYQNPQIDTTTMKDASYDLILRVRNIYGFLDDFYPDFKDDSEPSRNSQEKWLKHLYTWYNQDSEPDNNEEGKIVVDNTAPTISNPKP